MHVLKLKAEKLRKETAPAFEDAARSVDGVERVDAWPGEADADAAAEEQPGADGAAERNHRKLARGQAAGKRVFASGGVGGQSTGILVELVEQLKS